MPIDRVPGDQHGGVFVSDRLAADCSLKTVRDFLLEFAEPFEARFVLFDAGTYGAFARVLEAMAD